MRILLVTALAAVTAACGAYTFPADTANMGTVTGHVTAVPCSPVENPDSACKPFPVSGAEIDFTPEHGDVVRARTGEDGAYTVSLRAGTWSVTLKAKRVISGPSTVKVSAGSNTTADFVVDSGIRMPLAAA